MYDFRKCTRLLQKRISSLRGLLQNHSLETIQVCIVVLSFSHNNTAGIHLYDECMRSHAPSVCQKILSSFLITRASLFTYHKISVYKSEPSIDVSEQFVSKLWTVLQLIQFLLLKNDGHPSMALRLRIIVESFYLEIRNIFPHISFRDLPCHSTKKI